MDPVRLLLAYFGLASFLVVVLGDLDAEVSTVDREARGPGFQISEICADSKACVRLVTGVWWLLCSPSSNLSIPYAFRTKNHYIDKVPNSTINFRPRVHDKSLYFMPLI